MNHCGEGVEFTRGAINAMDRQKKQHGRRYEKSSRPNTKDRQHGGDCKDRKSEPTWLKWKSLPIHF